MSISRHVLVLALLVLLASLALADDDRTAREQIVKKLGSAKDAVRKEAFDTLREDEEARPRLVAVLLHLRLAWLERAKEARKKAAKKALPEVDGNLVAGLRRKARSLLRAKKYEELSDVALQLWEKVYYEPEFVDREPEVAKTRSRVLEFHGYLKELKRDGGVDYEKKLRRASVKIDGAVLAQRAGGSPRITAILDNPQLNPHELELALRINLYRELLKIPSMPVDSALNTCSRSHSRDMNKRSQLSHTSPRKGRRTPGERAARHGTTCQEEIIAETDSVRDALWIWTTSDQHHRSLVRLWDSFGLGFHEGYWTVMFH